MVRAFCWYGAPIGLATTPSRPAPSNCSNQASASAVSVVVRVRYVGPVSPASSCSNLARRTENGSSTSDSSPNASASNATKDAGVFSASMLMRDSAGWMRSCRISNSILGPIATNSSPSRTQRSGSCSRIASTTSGK